MTYTKTNTIIVFAFAALMMALPFPAGVAYAEQMDASLNANCGFTVTSASSINFGAFSKANNAATVGEEDAVFPAVVGSSASARVSVQVDDWKGAGTRSAGSATLVGVAVGENVVVGSKTYVAAAAASSGLNFDNRGDDKADAFELAKQIRDQDSAVFKVSTAGTNVVTMNVVARGTGGDGTTLSTTSASSSVSAFAGASDTKQVIMPFSTTKVDFQKDAASNSDYVNKVAITAKTTDQEVLGSTDPTDNVYLAIMIDPASATFTNLPYDGPLTQDITITVNTACDGT